MNDVPSTSWTDADLIRSCREGDERAWAALVDKYKKLVYSVPVKYRMSPEDSAEIFQSVWMELHNELDQLRNPDALRSWLMTVASHLCFQWKKRAQRRGEDQPVPIEEAVAPESSEFERQRREIERAQLVREAIQELPPRCREMVSMLFYEHPPLPYVDVARKLGLAEGSIGFIRGRCLQKLRQILAKKGF